MGDNGYKLEIPYVAGGSKVKDKGQKSGTAGSKRGETTVQRPEYNIDPEHKFAGFFPTNGGVDVPTWVHRHNWDDCTIGVREAARRFEWSSTITRRMTMRLASHNKGKKRKYIPFIVGINEAKNALQMDAERRYHKLLKVAIKERNRTERDDIVRKAEVVDFSHLGDIL
jgi:hypothetical protein